jgi:type IV secretory pathway VirB2 component (pilin)
LLAIAAYLLLVAPALAAGNSTPMGTVLCNIVQMFTGNLGRGLATLAVIVVGVGATLGKVSWGLAITVAVGIAVIFNANGLVSLLGAGISGCF